MGALVFVLDKDGDVGHAMVIGKVTGPSDSQIYVSAHTHDKKLVPLAECDSNHAFRIVVPEAFYLYSTPPAVRVTCNWKDNVPAGTTVTFSGNAERRSGGTCYRMAIEVIPPDKSTSSWSNGVMSTNSISHAFTLNQKGLYTIKIYAKETYNTSGNVSSTMTLRTY
ncbi:hypothetical protein [uncultured Neglectibacter sp.]|uniref:hypothetical protein n=1 Tax=uncultured Neglectibacter sp. TaxID=1924108 RepID=UPI0034E008CF